MNKENIPNLEFSPIHVSIVRGVSWSEVATVPKRKSHRVLDFNFSWNSEERHLEGPEEEQRNEEEKETGEEKQPQRNTQVHMHGWDDACKADLSHGAM